MRCGLRLLSNSLTCECRNPQLPGLEEARLRLLPLGHRLASLDRAALEGVTIPESQYQIGWSHGREKLVGDRPDLAKGSFYANPLCEDLLEEMLERRRYISDPRDDKAPEKRKRNDSIESVLKWDECPYSELQDEDIVTLAKMCPGFYHPNVSTSIMRVCKLFYSGTNRNDSDLAERLLARVGNSFQRLWKVDPSGWDYGGQLLRPIRRCHVSGVQAAAGKDSET